MSLGFESFLSYALPKVFAGMLTCLTLPQFMLKCAPENDPSFRWLTEDNTVFRLVTCVGATSESEEVSFRVHPTSNVGDVRKLLCVWFGVHITLAVVDSADSTDDTKLSSVSDDTVAMVYTLV